MFENRVEASAPEDPVDRPLDMTTNSRRPSAGVSAGVSVAQSSGRSPPPYPLLPAHSSGNGSVSGYPMYPSPPDYIARPSVITCASSLRSSPAPSCPSPCSSTGSVSSRDAQDRRIGAGSPLPPHHRPADTGRIPHRHISSGMFRLSDPFRSFPILSDPLRFSRWIFPEAFARPLQLILPIDSAPSVAGSGFLSFLSVSLFFFFFLLSNIQFNWMKEVAGSNGGFGCSISWFSVLFWLWLFLSLRYRLEFPNDWRWFAPIPERISIGFHSNWRKDEEVELSPRLIRR